MQETAAFGRSEEWEPVTLGSLARAQHLDRSEVLGFSDLVRKLSLYIKPAFLGCLLMSLHCAFLDAAGICGIHFSDNF